MSVDVLQSQNQIGVFIFLLPQSTDGEAFFCSPMYQSLRQSVSTRCACELSVFDGNDFSQLNLCLPSGHSNHLMRNNSKGNNCSNRSLSSPSALDSSSESSHSSLLLRVSNSYEQLLIARGNWLVQVVYKTVPSLHHLFLRLVGQYCTALGSSGYRRPSGSLIMRSQGFKYTVLAAITHSRIEEMRHQQSEYSLMNDLAYDSPVKSQMEADDQDNGRALISAGGQNKTPPWTQKMRSAPSSSVPSSTYPASSRSSNSNSSPYYASNSPCERTETEKRDDVMHSPARLLHEKQQRDDRINSPFGSIDKTQKREDEKNSPSRVVDEYLQSLTNKQDEYLAALRQQYKEFFSPVDRRGDDNHQREVEYEKNQLELDSEMDFSDSTNLDSLTDPIYIRKAPAAQPHKRGGFSMAEDWRSADRELGTYA
ncbi:unnamed protein product [Dibothriocephalus latus]|uniref:Uncharacterized protein n=1 Tax=Dibothriocephalus latus TaxID=60516 RepID=A0A3P7PYA8_DIBLA|nr:unnamed protein product [Dibothriocephalus latus]